LQNFQFWQVLARFFAVEINGRFTCENAVDEPSQSGCRVGNCQAEAARPRLLRLPSSDDAKSPAEEGKLQVADVPSQAPIDIAWCYELGVKDDSAQSSQVAVAWRHGGQPKAAAGKLSEVKETQVHR
jgi:hypothetical protein